MYLICKECYKKKYGNFPDFFLHESKTENICFICGNKKRMIDKNCYHKKSVVFDIDK